MNLTALRLTEHSIRLELWQIGIKFVLNPEAEGEYLTVLLVLGGNLSKRAPQVDGTIINGP